jgi:Putative Ig domain
MRRFLWCGSFSGLSLMLMLAPVAFAATPAPLWPDASELTLPANANTSAGAQNAALSSAACPSAGNCAAVGGYTDTTGATQALLATQSSGGAWAASELTLPGNANSTAGSQNAQLDAVDCPSAGGCVAVGHYKDSTGSVLAMVATQAAGGPWQASDLTLPANANTSAGHQSAVLDSVTCTSQGNCVATGRYLAATDIEHVMLATQAAGGVWQASDLTLPANANSTAGGQDAVLSSVVCASQGNCAAAGHYVDTTGSFQALSATQSAGGTWQTSELTLPANANSTAGAQNASLDSVACTSQGTCAATGHYVDTTGATQALSATQTSGGAWAASELTLPANADSTAGDQNASLGSVVCPSQGNCVAAGSYKDTAGNGQPLIATQRAGGAWQTSELTLPANADSAAGDQAASLKKVVCPSQGNCVAAGSYEDTTGSRQVMVATQSDGGAWAASELTQPAGAAASAQNAFLNSLACASAGYCTAAGLYKDTTGSFQALVVSSVAPLAVGTSSLPSGADGSAYSAQLSSTGGAGGGTWSLSSGSLPDGLSLNASTGVISGVPRAVGTSSFIVSVSDLGPPVQHASASLSIAVGPAAPAAPVPPASVRLVKVKTSGSFLILTLSCDGTSGERCAGTLKLSAREHLSGRTITALTASAPKRGPKKTTRTLTLAGAAYALTGASRKTFTITLNKTGKRLLAKYRKLPAKLTLTPTGARTPGATKTVTFRAPPAKRKHH